MTYRMTSDGVLYEGEIPVLYLSPTSEMANKRDAVVWLRLRIMKLLNTGEPVEEKLW